MPLIEWALDHLARATYVPMHAPIHVTAGRIASTSDTLLACCCAASLSLLVQRISNRSTESRRLVSKCQQLAICMASNAAVRSVSA